MTTREFSSTHSHDFTPRNNKGERRTWYVLILTLSAMFAEIIAGTLFGSMALLADGWHMGTHAAAFCITLFAYRYAKKHAQSGKYSFGAGKVSVLGGFTSAIALGIVALAMFGESIHRLFNPETIQFNEAIMVAILGLTVNVLSIFLLHDDHHHDHHGHHHGEHHHHDHNLKAAYMHVLADTLTSVLAIVALFVGKYLGWHWLDALMGIVGGLVIGKWTWGLLQQTAPVLLDASINNDYQQQIEAELRPFAQITDVHIWKISADHFAAIISIKNQSDKSLTDYQHLLAKFDKISHLTIELQPNDDERAREPQPITD
ncbi:CDF family Co(II)/Ni(II) efflux transporter DmeF [Vibrio sp. LaRot3]|uniref:CDF family Co(II)/Ni(II) efflux transporter DmeF n=1 Tax=Vibrio sp. LaRot3 TaxID=2998829 RepID=UPI0022CE004F|nr:CDF family Co(II)/Ni(II) efflux transporter DmeF [Vibrio sp. LaRot3]MDA0149010.1 CDF family Co(II)/Ni(II) efflux transporter DmeF [Vibrio sp. LaRot3]